MTFLPDRSRPRRLRASRAVAGLGLLALLLTAGPALGVAQPAAASGTGCAQPVSQPAGPFTIASDNRTILDTAGKPFISYGTTVPGLSQADFASNEASYITSVVDDKDIPKINATADFWCANTVRLQVSQYDVTQNSTPDGGSCSTQAGQDFLTKALDPEVEAAEADGLVVVINDQTESDPLASEERDPTKATFTFWDCVTAHHESWGSGRTYAQDPQVIFDIFNEPRADACTSSNGPYNMGLWRNGGAGPCGSNQPTYQGMDAVAYHLRNDDHAASLLWVEGPGNGNTLAGMDNSTECAPNPNCLITSDLGPIVYSIHHPYADSANPADSATWWKEFGYLVDHPAPSGQAPVVVGEWTNFTAAMPPNPSQSYSPYCWSNAPTSVPAFLSYLQTIGVGLNAYQLAGGYLLKASENWTDTTNYTDTSWQPGYCSYSPGESPPPLLGAGADVLSWFQSQD